MLAAGLLWLVCLLDANREVSAKSSILYVVEEAMVDGCPIVYDVNDSAKVTGQFHGFSDPHNVCLRDGSPVRPTVHEFCVNFQPADQPVPPNCIGDQGASYALQDNGFSYGWDMVNDHAVQRTGSPQTDERYNTFNVFVVNDVTNAWRMQVNNGWHLIEITAGDPDPSSVEGSYYRMAVEDQVVVDAAPTTDAPWICNSLSVEVTDGSLDVTSPWGATNNRICFMKIVGAGAAYPVQYMMPDKQLATKQRFTKSDLIPVVRDTMRMPTSYDTYNADYDERGNVIKDHRYHYTWDAFNRMTKAEDKQYETNSG